MGTRHILGNSRDDPSGPFGGHRETAYVSYLDVELLRVWKLQGVQLWSRIVSVHWYGWSFTLCRSKIIKTSPLARIYFPITRFVCVRNSRPGLCFADLFENSVWIDAGKAVTRLSSVWMMIRFIRMRTCCTTIFLSSVHLLYKNITIQGLLSMLIWLKFTKLDRR